MVRKKRLEEGNCKDLNQLYDTLDSLLNRMTKSHDLLEKVAILPSYDPCLDHSPIAGYVLFEKLTASQQAEARKELLKYAGESKRPLISVKPRLCKGVAACIGHYGRFYYEDNCVHSEDPANILLNRLPKDLNGVYVYFFKHKLLAGINAFFFKKLAIDIYRAVKPCA